MLHRFFGENIHTSLLTFGLCVLAIGIPLNKVVMSTSMMFISLNFLLEGDFKNKLISLKNSRAFWWLFAFMLLHVVGLIWSSNLSYALHDFRVKAPLIIIPLILLAKPVKNRQHIEIILYAFVSCTLITSLFNLALYHHWIGNITVNDIRGLSYFGSHVRYGLIVSMSIGILFYFAKNKGVKWYIISFLVWFIFYTFYSQVLSGVITFIGITFLYAIYLIWKKHKVMAIGLSLVSIILVLWTMLWIFKPMTIDMNRYRNLETKTAEGNLYQHEFDVITPETGEPTNIYVCEFELERDWPKYSEFDINGLDLKGQPLKKTLIRYLSSKKLRKDAIGLKQLSPEEFREIELGNASVVTSGLMARIYGLKHQMTNAKFPNNHSLLERIEYWKAGWSIFRKNIVFGVGTGDIQDAYDTEYKLQNSLLEIENRHRSHNMFLTVGVTFGIVGLMVFCGMIFQFLFFNLKQHELVGVLFIVIAILSFIPEDTLETQTGVTFFALFYGLFGTRINASES